MPTLKGVIVNGQTYHFDHEYLDNNPIPAHGCHMDYGKFLSVEDCSHLEWRDVLPSFDPTEGNDLHCVLTVEESYLEWQSAVRFLTGNSADDGDVLTVEKNGPYAELVWKSIDGGSSPLPTYDTTPSSSDEGKVLSINECGDLEWMTPSMMPDLPTSDAHDTPYVLGADGNGNADWFQIGGMMDSVLREHYDFNDNYVVDDGSGTPYVLVTSDNTIWWERLWDSDFDDYRLLPTYSMDDGKVLMVDSSAPAWVNAPWEDILPSIEDNDIGKVLRVTSDNHVEWDSELPSYGQSDAGKVLTVNNAGELEWAMPS